MFQEESIPAFFSIVHLQKALMQSPIRAPRSRDGHPSGTPGLVHNGKKFFALCNHECRAADNHNHKHIHFVCNKCDDVTCLDIDNFPKLKVPNYTFKDVNINVSGICSNCTTIATFC